MMFGNPAPYQPINGGMNVNPTGTNGNGGITAANPAMPAGGFTGAPSSPTSFTPPTGSPGNYGYGTSGNPNPTGTGPTVSMDPGGGTPPGTATVGNNAFAHTFGSGIAPVLAGEVNSQGGYNSALTQQDVQAQTAEMQLQANQNYGNLESGLGAAGINPNSSAAALENSNFWSQTTAAENSMAAQEYFSMWNDSQNRETSLLQSELPGLSGNRGGALQWFNAFSDDASELMQSFGL